MPTHTINNNRIAKNTLLLYVRMLLVMAVKLYTSRVVLNILGVEDYGIYNVVGGIVVMFSFLNSVMILSVQRFFSFEIGRGDAMKVAQIYETSLIIHLYVCLIFFVLAETFGLWFLNTCLNIPIHRMAAANWVYQFSVFCGIVNIMRIPYNALIISYEKMSFYAYMSIIEVLLSLGIVYVLLIAWGDRLIVYSALTFVILLIITLIYRWYCIRSFHILRLKSSFSKPVFKELISFSGWSLLLGVSNLSSSQGINMLFNIFHGVVINAAIGVVSQVSGAVNQFVSNFQTALNPQLIKNYATGEKDKLFRLLYEGSKLSFLLMLIIAYPIITNTEYILTLWLKIVPDYTVPFVQWALIYCLVDTLINPLAVLVQATGEIRKYQIACSLYVLSNLPLAFGLIYFSLNPVYVFIVRVIINIASLIWRLYYVRNRIGIVLHEYWKNVLQSVLISIALAIIISIFPVAYFSGVKRLLFSSLFWLFAFLPLIWLYCLTSNERVYVKSICNNLIGRIKRH